VTDSYRKALEQNERRKQMEGALKKSEAKYRQLVETAQEGIWTIDADAKTTYANSKMAEILGYSMEEMIGKSVFSFMDDKLVETAKRLMKRRSRGIKEEHDFEFIKKDGARIYAHLVTSPLTDKRGNFVGALALVTDITERKQADEALQTKDRQLASIYNNTSDVLFFLSVEPDDHFRFLTINPMFSKTTGLAENQVVGKLVREVIPEPALPMVIGNYKKAVREKSTVRWEETSVYPTGKKIGEVSITPVLDASGVCTHLIGIVHDVTERKLTEDSLRESEKRFRELADLLPKIVFETDERGILTFFNRIGLSSTGYTEEDLSEGFDVFQVFPPEDAKRAREAMRGGLGGGQTTPNEYTMLRKDGTTFPVMIQSTPIIHDGKPVGLRGTIVDMTERKRIEKELRSYREHLEDLVELRTNELKELNERLLKAERLAAIGEMATMIAHDIRNPLQSITATAYNLQMRFDPSDTQTSRMLAIIKDSVNYSNKIIADLLGFSKEMKVDLSKAALHSIITDTLEQVTIPPSIQTVNLAESELVLMIDREKMQRALSNIIENAVEAMPNGGELTISSRKANDSIDIVITDTGTGMTDEIMRKLFTPPFTTKAKGIGLGLAISKRIVEAHGGSITMETALGKGSSFTVRLPIRQALREASSDD